MNPLLIHQFYTFLLVSARVGGLMTAAPLFNNKAVPKQVRAGFILIFALALTPLIETHTGPIPNNLLLLVAGVFKDALFGLAVGFLASLLFASVQMAGYFIDTQMGFGFINLINPFSEQQSSPLSAFEYQLAITLYLLANGHLVLLGSLARSFDAVPAGAVALPAEIGLSIAPMLTEMFTLGLRMALPAIGVMLLIDVAFGLISRMVPQVNIFVVGMPAKIIMGLTTVTMLLPYTAYFVGDIIGGTSDNLFHLVTLGR